MQLIKAVLVFGVLLIMFIGEVSASDPFSSARNQAMKSAKAPLIPRQAFNWQSRLRRVSLSPNGAHLAYQVKHNRHLQIWRYDITGQSHEQLMTVKAMEEMHWAANSKQLFYVDSNTLFLAGMKAKSFAEKVYDLTDVNVEFLRPDPDLAEVFWLSRHLPRQRLHTLVRATVDGNEQTIISSEYPLSGFVTDGGELTIVEQWVGNHIQIGRVKENNILPMIQCAALAPCHVHHWNEENQRLLVSSYFDEDVQSLFSIDIATGQKQLIHQQPDKQFDISSVVTTQSGTPYLVSYKTDYAQHYALTTDSQTTLDKINTKTNSRLNKLLLSKAQNVWLIVDQDPRHAGARFHIYLAQSDKWQSPFEHFKTASMDEKWLAPRVPFWYTASDGMQLQGYLTLPLGAEPKNVPLIVNPHGGPWNRSSGEFNRFAQFLANRGYAVFEPNFRSSTGLGRNYVFSANKDFGDGRVQQDIIDGLDYLLAAGIGDPEQLAIAGHSFGGFSALAGLAFSPNRFRVGFAGAAPSNLGNTILRFSQQMPPAMAHRNQPRFRELMADITDPEDVKRLYQQSPDMHWQNISRPLYLWGGEKDNRVAIEDIRSMALRLESANKEVVLIADPREGHSPEKELAREAYLYMLEHALAMHLSGRAELSVSPLLKRYLSKTVVIDTANFTESINNVTVDAASY